MKKILIIIMGVLIYSLSLAQKLEPDALSNAGDHMEGSNINLDWTLGLNESETMGVGDNNLTQGVQQANLKVTTNIIDLAAEINLVAYPNPSANYVVIEKSLNDILDYQVYSILGEKLSQGILDKPINQLDWSGYLAGSYIISLSLEGKLIGSIKVEKL